MNQQVDNALGGYEESVATEGGGSNLRDTGASNLAKLAPALADVEGYPFDESKYAKIKNDPLVLMHRKDIEVYKAELERMDAKIKQLVEALGIAGNHLASTLPHNFLPHTTPHEVALEMHGAGAYHDVWTAWKIIHQALANLPEELRG